MEVATGSRARRIPGERRRLRNGWLARFGRSAIMRPRTAGATRLLALEQLESRLALATFFVATSGNDSSDGSSGDPWLTLQRAADVVNPGDSVVVRAGNYVGFYLDRDGTAADRIVFQAEPGVTITQR